VGKEARGKHGADESWNGRRWGGGRQSDHRPKHPETWENVTTLQESLCGSARGVDDAIAVSMSVRCKESIPDFYRSNPIVTTKITERKRKHMLSPHILHGHAQP